jgi:hypothetical protein
MDRQLTLAPTANVLALIAAAASGGGAHWGYLAMQAAGDPSVHKAVQHAGAFGLQAGAAAAAWASEHADADELCMAGWNAVALAALLGLGGLILFISVCCGCCACVGGGSWWLGRHGGFILGRPIAVVGPDLVQSLAQTARFLETGGESAVRQVAGELHVTEDAVREWWVLWQRALRGPRRQHP